MGPRAVIRLNLEDDAACVLSPNLIAGGADMKLVEIVDREAFKNGELTAVDFSRPGCVEDLLRLIKQFNAALTIIEPVTNYKGKAKSNSDDDMRPIYQHLAFVAKDSGSSVLTINHVNKKKDVDVLDKALGAGSGPNVARVNLYLNSPEADPDSRLLTDAGSNLPMCKKSMSFGLVKHAPFEHDGKTLTGCETVVFKSFNDKTAEEMHDESVAPDKKDANKIATWLKEFIGDREVPTQLVKTEAFKENRKWEWANIRQTFKRTCDAKLAQSRKDGKTTYWSFGAGHKEVESEELPLSDSSFDVAELEEMNQ
jgi:RecA-family ATPase